MEIKLVYKAERVGFEPTDSLAIKRFRVVRFRPLSHLSYNENFKAIFYFLLKIF